MATHVVILAGGSGTRLWPLSRRRAPKQFQPLVTQRSLIQETFDRVRPLADPAQIWVATTSELVELCREHLPEVPAGNLLVEPALRNTGPAIGYATARILADDPGAVVVTIHSDHVIGLPARFREALRLACAAVAATPDCLLTIGIAPTWGNPGFGYIKAPGGGSGEELAVVPVERFVEKPSPAVAAQYVESGQYYWNAGYFVFRAATMRAAIARHDAALAALLAQLGTASAAEVSARYPDCRSVPIDQLVFEPESAAGRVATIPAALEWDDLGSWKTLRDVLCRWHAVPAVTRGEVALVDSPRSLVYAHDKLVALVGCEDLIVVDTPDALLICRADRSEDVREALAALDPGDPRR
ncbi:MAG: mannose-1-phosphate guanylyltransferase [Fimbriimonadaceae bacterium]|nr:mannose-1-phosphate guanylyltransferase [Fimbriimonadaceae bacterium]